MKFNGLAISIVVQPLVKGPRRRHALGAIRLPAGDLAQSERRRAPDDIIVLVCA